METTPPFMTLLRRLRRARDLSQEALAQQAFCGLGTIKSLEVGRRRPSRELATQLADVLELSDTERAAFLAAARTPAVPSTAATGTVISEATAHANTARRPLPYQATSFIGRAREQHDLQGLIAQPATRLITIVAPGGMGKTRLALAALEQAQADGTFADAVAFAALAPLDTADPLDTTVADALGLPLTAAGARTPRQQLLDYLRAKRLLLALDNCEHLGEAVADLASAILAEAPGVTLLATSRERLGLRAEHVFPLDGLRSEVDGVALFVGLARLAQPAFALDAATRAQVAAICAQLGGMPLAIELAAGWADTLGLAEIAAELARGDALLVTQARDMPARHRSMRAVCDATWARLGAPEQAIFAQVAVFRGDGTRRALQAVTGAGLGQLQALVGKALLRYDPARERYSVHELLRQYAEAHLRADMAGERAARERHAAYYLVGLERRTADLKGPGQLRALDEIGKEAENVRAAWAWAAENGALTLLAGAVESLRLAYEWLGRSADGLAAMRLAADAAAATPEAPAALHATLLAAQARFTFLLGDAPGALQLLERAQALLDAQSGEHADAARARVLLELGQCLGYQNFRLGHAALNQSLRLFHTLGDRYGIATAMARQAVVADALPRGYADAQHLLEQSVALHRGLGDSIGLSEALHFLSMMCRFRNQVPESEALAREAYALAQATGNPHLIAQAGNNLGAALYWSNKNEESVEVLRSALELTKNLGHRSELPEILFALGAATMFLGRYAEARAIFSEGLAIAEALNLATEKWGLLMGLSYVALAAGANAEARHLAEESVALHWSVGNTLVTSIALGLDALAARRLGDRKHAQSIVVDSLRDALSIQYVFHVTLVPTILLLADDNVVDRAAAAYSLLERLPICDNPLYQDIGLREIRTIIAALPPDVAAAAQARWAGRDVWQAGAELLAELEADGWGAE